MEIFLEYELDLKSASKWNTISATAASKSSLLYLQESGDFICGPNYFTTREGFSSFLIKITLEGCGHLEYQGQQYDLPPGHMFWLDCRKRQSYRTHADFGHWRVLWVHFYGANAQFFYDLFLSQNGGSPVVALSPKSPAFDLLFSLVNQSRHSGNQQYQDLESANLLHQLISECTLSTIRANQTEDTLQTIQVIRTYLSQNFREKITLEELGRQFNLSPFYLQKQFKRYTGQSPTEYQIHLRMTRAKELMRTTTMSISQISRMVGIENLGYFTRQFKKQEGMTPQEYCRLWPTIIEESPE